jgi:hypothetical protein
MIMRSASSLDLNLRAAQKPSVPRVVTTARTVSAATPRVAKPITRASSDGNLYKIQSPESITKTISVYHEETASLRVLEGSRLPQGGSNGGFGGRGGDGAGGGGGGGGGSVDGYYEEMIQRYPGDTLLLSNYARFLKEVKGDGRKAEEYCERAMLSEPTSLSSSPPLSSLLRISLFSLSLSLIKPLKSGSFFLLVSDSQKN